jgi:hypothetical protein
MDPYNYFFSTIFWITGFYKTCQNVFRVISPCLHLLTNYFKSQNFQILHHFYTHHSTQHVNVWLTDIFSINWLVKFLQIRFLKEYSIYPKSKLFRLLSKDYQFLFHHLKNLIFSKFLLILNNQLIRLIQRHYLNFFRIL